MPSLQTLLALSLALGLSIAAPLCPPSTNLTQPIPPSQDPFYTAPTGFESAAPGTILRYRSAPGNLTTILGNSSAAYNILFRTTNSLYQPAFAVTTFVVPSTPFTAACPNTTNITTASPCHALLSYQIPYDTVDVDDSPSFSLYTEPQPDINNALASGWFVSVPDFAGPLTAFLAGILEGHATLDSVRAALAFAQSLNLLDPQSTQYAMWGYSGGSIASEFAAELQAEYAPELSFAGMAIGGMPVNISSVLELSSGGPFAGLVPGGLVGITDQFPAAQQVVIDNLKPENKSAFLAIRNMTENEALATYGGQDAFGDYFVDGEDILLAPELQKIFNSEGIIWYHGIPQMPIFAYKAVNDELSPIADSDALLERYCGVGVDVLYQRNSIGGHEAESINGDGAAFDWLSALFNGTLAVQAGCLVQNVSINISSLPF